MPLFAIKVIFYPFLSFFLSESFKMPFRSCKEIRAEPCRAAAEGCAAPVLSSHRALGCGSGVGTGPRRGPCPAPGPQTPGTAEVFLRVTAQERRGCCDTGEPVPPRCPLFKGGPATLILHY